MKFTSLTSRASEKLPQLAVDNGPDGLISLANDRLYCDWGLKTAYAALRPGGVLAIEQHRSVDGLNPDVTAPTGYMPESHVIRAAEAAGFVLEARSELNANPKDDHDHPYGDWTLPPVRTSAPREGNANDRVTPLTEAERAEDDAIGESDRMTLRFRKPG